MHLRASSIALLLMTAGLVGGCHHAGTIPHGWRGEPLPPDAFASHPVQSQTPGNGDDRAGDGDRGQLQVFICYGKVLSNHCVLRLTAPGKQTLMWDPGGTYGQFDPKYARRHDVLTQNATSVDQWWRYRRDGCLEPVMEVFQWELDPGQANRLHALLLTGEDPTDPTQTFEPSGAALQCSNKVSEFLMRFADGRPFVPHKMFWPHDLGEHLWTQSPDRVMVFKRNGPAYVYRRDTPQAVGAIQGD